MLLHTDVRTSMYNIKSDAYPMDDDKNKGFKGSYIRGESRAHRKPRPFYTNSIVGSRLPAVVEKHKPPAVSGDPFFLLRAYNIIIIRIPGKIYRSFKNNNNISCIRVRCVVRTNKRSDGWSRNTLILYR